MEYLHYQSAFYKRKDITNYSKDQTEFFLTATPSIRIIENN